MKGSVYKVERKKGYKWKAQVDLPKRDGEKRKRKTQICDTKSAAEDWVRKIQNEIDEYGFNIDKGDQTLRKYMKNWLKKISKKNHRPKTHYDYKKIVQTHIVPELGDVRMKNLTPSKLQEFVHEKSENGRVDSEGGLSVGSVKKIFHVLSGALTHAVKMKIIRSNPAKGVELPKDNRKQDEKYETWSNEELRRFLEVSKEESSYGPVYRMAAHYGLRISEITGLRWSDIDFEKRKIQISQSLVQIGGKMKFGPPKTKEGEREIEFTKDMNSRLKKHKQQQNKRKMKLGPSWEGEHELVFPATNGAPLRHRNLRREFNQLIEKAGVPQVRFHSLRHSCATLLLEQNEHPKIVKKLLGHSSIETTLDTYSHVSTDLQARACQKLEDNLEDNNGQGTRGV